MISAFGVEHGGISKKLNESTKKGAEVGALFGGSMGGTRGALHAIEHRKAIHSLAGGNKGLARGAMVGHTIGRGARGAVIGGAALGAVGYAARPRNGKKK